jgi:predicted CopG family antitoxin
MHFKFMAYTTLTVRQDVAKRLRANKSVGESYSDMLARLLDNQPAKTVGEWLESLVPHEGRALFSSEDRERLKRDQRIPRESHARRKSHAAA